MKENGYFVATYFILGCHVQYRVSLKTTLKITDLKTEMKRRQGLFIS